MQVLEPTSYIEHHNQLEEEGKAVRCDDRFKGNQDIPLCVGWVGSHSGHNRTDRRLNTAR